MGDPDIDPNLLESRILMMGSPKKGSLFLGDSQLSHGTSPGRSSEDSQCRGFAAITG